MADPLKDASYIPDDALRRQRALANHRLAIQKTIEAARLLNRTLCQEGGRNLKERQYND